MEAITKTIDLSFVKHLLSKSSLISWVKKHTADNLQTDVSAMKSLEIETGENTIMIMDSGSVKGLITDTKFTGEVHSSYDLEQVSDVVKTIGKEGKLIITTNPQSPLVIQIGEDLVVLAPSVITDDVKAKKEEAKNKKSETDEEDSEDSEEEVDEDKEEEDDE